MIMQVFRLVISIATEMNENAEYLQAKVFEREVFVYLPIEFSGRNVLCEFTAAAFGIVDSVRLRYLTYDNSITQQFGIIKSKYELALNYRRNDEGSLVFLLVTQVDNYICRTT